MMKLACALGVIVLAALCAQASDEYPFLTPGDNVPLSYNLTISTDMDTFQFSGRIDILVLAYFSGTTVVLHTAGMNISVDQVQFTNLYGRKFNVVNLTHDIEHEMITIEVDELMKDGFLYICSVSFVSQLGTSPEHGYYRYSYLDTTGVTRWVALTDFQYTKARRVFPCYDEPEMKASFLVTMIHRSQYTAFSSAPVQSVVPHYSKEGWVVTTFENTESLTTYKLGFMVAEVGSAATVEAGVGKFPLQVLTKPNEPGDTTFAMETAGQLISQIEDLILYEFPLDKLDIVAAYNNSHAHNWGLIVLRDEVIVEDANTGRLDRAEHAWMLSNALVDQWIGCLVTAVWWSELWGFSGLRNEISAIVLNKVFPDWNLRSYKRAESLNVVFKYDSLPSAPNLTSTSLRDPSYIGDVFDKPAASKGFMLYGMISALLGEELFGPAVDYYMEVFNFGSGDVENIYTYVMKMTRHQEILPDSVTMKQIMDTWTFQPGYPSLTVQRDTDTGTLTITQTRFLLPEGGSSSDGEECWWIPVTYTTAKSPYFNKSITSDSWWDGCNQTQHVLQTNTTAEDWIMVNIKASVICHVNYDPLSWSLLVSLLTTGDVTLLDEMNCFQLIKDVFALAHAGDVEYPLAFQVLKYLKRESRLIPWLAGIQTLAGLQKFFWRSTLYSEFQGFERWLVEDLYTAHNALSSTEVLGSVEEWRYNVTLTQAACDAQVTSCVSSAAQTFRAWMYSDCESCSRIDPDIRRLVYREGVRQGIQADYDFLWNKYLTSSSDNEQKIYLDALACSTQQDLLEQLLDKILDSYSGLRRQHVFITFSYVAQNSPLGFNTTVEFLNDNFQSIYNLEGTIVNYVSQLLEGMVYASEVEQMKALVTAHSEMFLHSGAQLNRSLAVAEANLLWNDRYHAQVSTLLQVTV